jgi:AcrR family transcriptional regulator
MPYVKADERRSQVIAAARAVLARDGVAGTTMRSVAAEAQTPLGNLHYVFQTKEQLFRAVLEDFVNQMRSDLVMHSPRGGGLARSLREGLRGTWTRAMRSGAGMHLLQYELTTYALRTPGLTDLARWQYEQYCEAIEGWCRKAADDAGEVCAIGFDALARILVAALDGLILQYVSDPDDNRAGDDLEHVITGAIALADPKPAPRATDQRRRRSAPAAART